MEFSNPNNFGLPISSKMLGMDSQAVVGVLHSGEGEDVTLVNKFFEITVHVAPDGKSSQLELDSRPAFEVAVLSMVDGKPHVMLIQKKRTEQRGFRDVEMITKVPGGYFHDGSNGNMDFVIARMVEQTGYQLDPSSIKFFGVVIGHTEIRTPIVLGYATRCSKIQDPAKGVNVMIVPLEEALQMAENAVTRTVPFLENDTAFEGLTVIDRMFKRGDIVLI
jgi:hypothetical protein